MSEEPLLAGRFESTGADSQVLMLVPALDRRSGDPVLIRVLRPRNESLRRQLVRECQLLSRLRHPGLARILDVIEEGDRIVLAIDPLHGRTLSDAAAAQPLPQDQVLQVLEQLATTLDFLHSQNPPIYLGRLEPGGIVLTPSDQVLIADVVSAQVEMVDHEKSEFWAPEVESQTPATLAQDLFSLGAVGWLLAAGGTPSRQPLADELPAAFRDLLKELVQPAPAQRPAFMRSVLARLQALRGKGPAAPIPVEEAPAASKGSLWDVLFTPLSWQRPAPRTRAVPEEEGEHARQARDQVPLLDLGEVKLDREVARILPEATARSISGVVVERTSDDELVLALKDPTFVHAYDYVRMGLGRSVQLRLCRAEPEMVDQALEYVYRSQVYAESVSWAEWLVRRSFHQLPLQVENPIADTSIWGEPLPNRVIDAVDTILKEALAVGASDIHFETFRRFMDVRYRIDGVLKRISSFSSEQASAMLKRIKVLANMDIAQERVPQGGRISVRVGELECDLRVSLVPVQGGESAVLRVLRKSAKNLTLTELGFPEALQETFQALLQQPYGMILVCGPTGSGKTTTLYSSLKLLARPDRKLLTVEDPVEYEMAGITQVQVDTSPREPERRVTFARVLREFLRQDPDVILVGEIRDPETAEVAVQAALTGHLLLSTLHANEALGVFARLREMGIEPFLIGTSLLGALAQRLARRICDQCREECEVPADLQQRMHEAGVAEPKAYHGRGCAACLGSGFRGRVGIYELIVVTPSVRRCILAGADETQLEAALQADGGYRRLYQHGLQLAAQGVVTLDEVVRVTRSS